MAPSDRLPAPTMKPPGKGEINDLEPGTLIPFFFSFTISSYSSDLPMGELESDRTREWQGWAHLSKRLDDSCLPGE